MEQAEQEEGAMEDFLIVLATNAIVSYKNVTTKEYPKMFDETWNHSDV